MLSQKEFNDLTPYQRGYTVYLYGANPEEPNVPDEQNPYPKDSNEHFEYLCGAAKAVLEVLDMVE